MDPSPATGTPTYTIIISEKGGAERREAFDAAELHIGRVQGNDLVLAKGNVSKRHAKLLFREGRFVVNDLNSTNGTYVNRRRIAQATIVKEGDRIYIGDYVLRIDPGVEIHEEQSEKTGRPAFATTPDRSGLPSYPGVPSTDAERITRPPEPIDVASFSSAPPAELSPDSGFGTPESEPPPEEGGELVGLLSMRVLAQLQLESLPLQVSEELEAEIRSTARALVGPLLREQPPPEGVTSDDLVAWTLAELAAVGPLTGLLEDPEVIAVAIPRRDQLLVTRRDGVHEVQPAFSSEEAIRLAIARLAAEAGEPIGDTEVVVDRRLARGIRLSAVLGPAAPSGALLVLRKPRSIAMSMGELVRRGVISRQIAILLEKCVTARLNLLVVGPRDEGASFLLSALCATAKGDRVIALSDMDDVVAHTRAATRMSLSASGADSARLLRIASRVPEARLVVTLATPDVAASTIEAIGDGIDGVIASLRAPDLTRALARLPADIAVARPGISLEAAREWVQSSFDVVLEVARQRDGRIRLLRVAELSRDTHAGLEAADIFTFVPERVASGGAIEGSFVSSGVEPRIAERMRAMSVGLEPSLFSRPPSAPR